MNHRILYIYFESILGHLYPQKTPENQSFFDIFRRYRIFGLKWVNVFWCYLRMKIKISNSLRLRKIIFVLSKRIKLEVLASLSSRAFNVRKMNTLKGFKGIVKRAEPCKCDILIVSRIFWHKRITTFFKRMEIFMFYTHRRLSAIIAPYKFTQGHANEGCLFSSEKTCDVEC